MRTITLPARCDRAATEALLPEFQAALGTGPLSIDATETQQIGQAMLQLLISARRTGEGATITPSSALRDTARLTGLEAALFEGTMA
jgi:anti-anti-sigma regulatory factor